MILQESDLCPHSNKCPYARANGQVCLGTMIRQGVFTCHLVKTDGTFVESGVDRTVHNVSGTMEVLLEES